jgi:hypothetical protein
MARIDANAAVNAFVAVVPDGVLAAAAKSEVHWRQGTPLGPIDGVADLDQGQYLDQGPAHPAWLENQ